jgi:SAM-dependent methyltransferase
VKTESKACLGCSCILTEAFLNLGVTPLANAYIRPEQAHLPEVTVPLAVAYCPACHLVQLTDLVPPEKMFSEYLYFSSYSNSFLAHAREMVTSLTERFHIGAQNRVIEIASNDGYLLQYFQQRKISVLGVEPAANIAEEAERRGIPTLKRFFDSEVVQEIVGGFGQADLIIGNNVLAHVPAINDFLRATRACLKPTGAAVFEFPYVKELLDKTEFDTIYHEHVFYYSLSAIENLVERAGLQLFDVSYQPVHGGSLRVFLQYEGTRDVTPAVEAMLTEEKAAGLTRPERYVSFSRDVAALKQELLGVLYGLKAAGKRLAAYGAPAKGNTLLNYCGIGTDLLEFTVDRSPHKQGLLTPGSHLPIRPPEDLIKEMPNYAVILPWNIADEIVTQQEDYIRKGGKFIIPVPKPKIV